jgi:hypothetical protein
MYQNIQKLKENPDTENIGKKWTEEEITILLNEIKENKSINDIALSHKRTVGSINSKLLSIGQSLLINKKIEISEACKIINMSIEHLKEYIAKKNKQKENTKENTITETILSEFELDKNKLKSFIHKKISFYVKYLGKTLSKIEANNDLGKNILGLLEQNLNITFLELDKYKLLVSEM